jgi:hypothetical protein
MKHLLTGVAVVAALACSGAVWAQPTSPGGNAVGMPGSNPGGPGLTPYTTGPRPAPPPPSASPAPMYPPAAPLPSAPPAAMSGTETAAPPPYSQDRAQYAAQKRTARRQRGAASEGTGGDIANQLNQQELSRLQAGSYSNPPPPRYASPPPPPRSRPPLGTTGGGAPYRP